MTIQRVQLLVTILLAIMTPAVVVAGGQGEVNAGSPRGVPEYDARLEYVEGDVTIGGTVASIGMAVEPGEVIETGADGSADVVFGTQNLLRLEPGTVVVFDPASEGFAVEAGSVAAIFDKLQSIGVGPDDTFAVRTPTTVAGVRGTTFFIRIESVDSTYICTCHGVLAFDGASNRPELQIAAARHTASRFVRDGNTVVWEEAPEIYHDSASLNEAADTIGVVIPWGEDPH